MSKNWHVGVFWKWQQDFIEPWKCEEMRMTQHQTVGVCVQILHSGPTHESFKQGHEKHLPDVLHAFFPQQFSKMELESHKFCDLKMMI